MSRDGLQGLYRGFLGLVLGASIIGVPYAITTPPLNALNGGVFLIVILFCVVGMVRWGGDFFERISTILNQSGLY